MEVVYLKKFGKDLDKIKQPKDRKSIEDVIQSVKNVKNLESLSGVKKTNWF